MKSDTPETDAFLVRMSARRSEWKTTADWAAAHNATLDHARKMERGKNEALRQNSEMRVMLRHHANGGHTPWKSEVWLRNNPENAE